MAEQERMTRTVRQLRSGQITIPADFRRRLGIERDAALQMTLADGELRIRPMQAAEPASRTAWFQKLYDFYAPVREEAEQKHFTDEEINKAIDQAVTSVRRKHT
jgi:bifunctional DNA-binding transcriptional regulator/antitoxin component of YhaV-PrlF toxin-antitoxin module